MNKSPETPKQERQEISEKLKDPRMDAQEQREELKGDVARGALGKLKFDEENLMPLAMQIDPSYQDIYKRKMQGVLDRINPVNA